MEKLLENIREAIIAAKPLDFSDIHEVRISCELCDRGHMEASLEKLYVRAGIKMPVAIFTALSDPDFDVRMQFMRAIAAVMEEETAPDKNPVGFDRDLVK